MSTEANMNQLKTVKSCIAPEVGQFVADYLFDLLPDSEALQVELHLVDCYSCKERYHTVLRASTEIPDDGNSILVEVEPVTLSAAGEKMAPAPKGQFIAGRKGKYAKKASGGI